MRTFLASVAGVLAMSGVAVAADPNCTALSGAQDLLSSKPHYVLLGEAHGTNELPAVFGELVCAAAKVGPVTVGLEFLPAEQARLDAYLGSDGSEAARADLVSGDGWNDQHGRASVAILQLVEHLRLLKAQGADLAVVAFDHPSDVPGTSDARESGMAKRLMEAKAARPQAMLMALTGAGHAGKSAWTSFNPTFPAMSQHLPDASTIAIAFERPGGEVWACRPPAEAQPPVCRAWTSTARDPVAPRAVKRDTTREGYEAVVSPGAVFTASPPAR
jgi:hypothetical protein